MRLLSDLKLNESGTVHGYSKIIDGDESAAFVRQRLLDMGLVAGSTVTLKHQAPFGKDPIAVEVRGTVIGLRREEAAQIILETP